MHMYYNLSLFLQILALDEFPSPTIQSKTNANAREFPENCHVSMTPTDYITVT